MGVRAVATMTASGITPSPLRGEGWGAGREVRSTFPSPLRGEGRGAGREVRSTFLGATSQESLNAVDELLAPGLRLLQVRLELQRLFVARLERVVDGPLGRRQRLPRL